MPNDGTEQRKLAAIMFTDMVGYSALSQRNEALALELLSEQQRLLRTQFPLFNGREVKTTGDGFLVEFPSALEASQCAVEIQRAVVARNSTQPTERHIHVRIGIHVGDVVHREADMYGDGVNIAARIEPLAKGGGICLSDAVYGQVRNKLGLQMTKLASPDLKHIEVPMEVYRVVLPWQEVPRGTSGNEVVFERDGKQKRRGPILLAFGAFLVLALMAGLRFLPRTGDPGIASSAPTHPLVPTGRSTTNIASEGRRVRTTPISSLAVLPLVNLSHDPDQEYFVDGITELLCTDLASLSALKKVTSRTTVMQYKKTTKTTPQIATELGVDAILEGSAQREGNLVVVSVQLIDGATDRHLWQTNFEQEVGSLLKLKTDLARLIAKEINARLTPQEERSLASAPRRDPEAMVNYLRGRDLLNQQTFQTLTNSITYFRTALGIEPNYAEAYAGIAHAYASISSVFKSPREMMPLARTNALEALRLDDTVAEAHFVLGFIEFNFDYDFRGAEQEFQRSLSLNPGYADAHDGRALYLPCLGRLDEALAEEETAFRLDPLSRTVGANYIWTCMVGREYARAIRLGSQILRLQSDNHMAVGWMAFAYSLSRDPRNAIKAVEPICGRTEHPPMLWGSLAYAQAVAGERENARRSLDTLEKIAQEQYLCVYEIATVYVALGQHDKAFGWLDKALEARADCIPFTEIDPRLEPLRRDERFKEFVGRIGLKK